MGPHVAARSGLGSRSHDGCHRGRWHRRAAGPKSRSSTRTRRAVLSHRPRRHSTDPGWRSVSHGVGGPFRSCPADRRVLVLSRESPGMDAPRLMRGPPVTDVSPHPLLALPARGQNANAKPLGTYSLKLDLAPGSAMCVPGPGCCPPPLSPRNMPHRTSLSF